MPNRNQNDVVYAGFFIRLSAYLIDTILVTFLLAFLRLPVWVLRVVNPDMMLTRAVIFRFSIWDIILYLLGVTYFILITYKTGTTIGKRLMGLKVISVEGELSLLNVCYRETIGRYLSGIIINIGYFVIAVDNEKRGFHDMLCDTRVVYANMVSAPVYKPQSSGNVFNTQTTVQPTRYEPSTSKMEEESKIRNDKEDYHGDEWN